jgi:hypothetical protein
MIGGELRMNREFLAAGIGIISDAFVDTIFCAMLEWF